MAEASTVRGISGLGFRVFTVYDAVMVPFTPTLFQEAPVAGFVRQFVH